MAVKIFGHSFSTPAAVAVGGGSLVAVYFAYKQHKASSASASATDPTAIDPVTGLPYSQDNQIDPLTGMAYLAEAQQYGSVSAAEQATAGEASASLSSAYGSSPYETGSGVVGSSGTTSISSGGYASNAAWAQAVTAGLTALGYTSTDISAALGMYLGGLPLTDLPDGQSAASIVEAALAEYGPPPVGSFTAVMPSTGSTGSGSTGSGTTDGGVTTGPTGTVTTTPAVITTGPTGTVTTGPTGTVTTTPAVITVAPTGFRVVSVTNGDNVNLAWNAVKGATGYVIAYGPTSGSQEYKQGVGGGGTTEATVPGVGAGTAGKHYFELWATPAKTGGPHAGPIEATTTKS